MCDIWEKNNPGKRDSKLKAWMCVSGTERRPLRLVMSKMISGVEHLFMMPVGHPYVFFGKMSIQVLCPFFNFFFFFGCFFLVFFFFFCLFCF